MARTKLLPTIRLLCGASLFASLVGAPVTLDLDTETGVLSVKASVAAAKDGRSGGDDSGGSSGSGGGGDDSGGDNSGSGSSGSDDGDSSGNSGPGGGGGDNDGDDDHDDDDRDDNSGRGRGGDRDRNRDRDDDGGNGRHHLGPNGEKIEIEGNKIEVTYADGYKEEIENGIFEMKDPNGRTVVERRATAADIARLRGLAR